MCPACRTKAWRLKNKDRVREQRQRRAARVAGAVVPETKVCSRCGVEKPAAEYYDSPLSKDKLSARCRDCLKNNSKPMFEPVTVSWFQERGMLEELKAQLEPVLRLHGLTFDGSGWCLGLRDRGRGPSVVNSRVVVQA